MTIAFAGRCLNIVNDVRFFLQEENWKDTISDEMILRLMNRCLAEEISTGGNIRDDADIDLVQDQEAYDYPTGYVSLISAAWNEDHLPIECTSNQGDFEGYKAYVLTYERVLYICLRPTDFLVWPVPSAAAAAAMNFVFNKQGASLTGYQDVKATITYFNRTAADTGIFKTAVAGSDVTVGSGQTNANVVVGSVAQINGAAYAILTINGTDHKTVTLDGDPSSGTVTDIVGDRSVPPVLEVYDKIFTWFCLKETFARKQGKKNAPSLVQYYTGLFNKAMNDYWINNSTGGYIGSPR
ncbi:MAG: hypothetical protein WC891_08885 [Actinomycetota bacterium]